MPDNRRRQASRRRLERQLQRRQQQQKAIHKRRRVIGTIAGALVAALIAVVLLFTVGTSTGGKEPTAATPTPTPAGSAGSPAPSGPPVFTTSGPCKYTQVNGPSASEGGLKDVGMPPDPSPTPNKTLRVNFTTNRGVIEATLDGAGAPCNVQAVAYLIHQGFYDNTSCPRVVNSGSYLVQCGSGNDSTTGGPDFTLPDENLAHADYSAGSIAMVNNGQPNTAGSQFFFVTRNSNAMLGKKYTVIGHVTTGLRILRQVAAGGNNGNAGSAGGGKPKLALVFKAVHISSVTPPGPTPGVGPTPTLVVPGAPG